MMGMTTMQTYQYGKSAIFKIFHTRVTPVKSITTLLSRQQCLCSKLRIKSSFLYRIQGIRVDCLVSGQVWILLRIAPLLQISVKLIWSLKNLREKDFSWQTFLRKAWLQVKSMGDRPLNFLRPTLHLRDCRYLITLLDLFLLHLIHFSLGKT